jgi:two-component system response regulator MtrA
MLLEQVWGFHHTADTRAGGAPVNPLRVKVEDDPGNPQVFMTVPGVRYRAGSNV